MKRIVLSLAVLTLSLSSAWALEAPAAPAPPSTPAVEPALMLNPLFSARPTSDTLCLPTEVGTTCTLTTTCEPQVQCINEIGVGVKVQSCRCCDGSFPPHCTSTVQSVSCGC